MVEDSDDSRLQTIYGTAVSKYMIEGKQRTISHRRTSSQGFVTKTVENVMRVEITACITLVIINILSPNNYRSLGGRNCTTEGILVYDKFVTCLRAAFNKHAKDTFHM